MAEGRASFTPHKVSLLGRYQFALAARDGRDRIGLSDRIGVGNVVYNPLGLRRLSGMWSATRIVADLGNPLAYLR